jgi:hypothetical protein
MKNIHKTLILLVATLFSSAVMATNQTHSTTTSTCASDALKHKTLQHSNLPQQQTASSQIQDEAKLQPVKLAQGIKKHS